MSTTSTGIPVTLGRDDKNAWLEIRLSRRMNANRKSMAVRSHIRAAKYAKPEEDEEPSYQNDYVRML
jgi:hypothetical protein